MALLTAFQTPSAPCADSAKAVTPASLPWVHLVEHLGCERVRLTADIARGHARLKERVEREAPALMVRIEVEPPKPRPTGYGLLPELTADAAESSQPLRESRYSIQHVLGVSTAERRAAGVFAERAQADTLPLEPQVRELERLRRQLRWIESSITYHRFWQKSGDDSRAFFDRRNELVQRARALNELVRAKADTAMTEAIRRPLAAELAPFAATPGLAWRLDPDGTRILPVEVATDIADSAFLAAFKAAVQRAWSDSPAAREANFRVELTLKQIRPEELYPEGVPAVGAAIVETDHVARFPKGALVLTTGGKSTHAWVGRYIQLGTAPFGPRTLAHEFSHLLGFSDGYLRGTEGSSSDPFGYVFVEWTGIIDDLMGSSSAGRVTEEMVAQMVAAYRPPPS